MQRPIIALFGKTDDQQLLAAAKGVEDEGGTSLCLNMGLDERQAPLVSMGETRTSWDSADFSKIESMYIRGLAPNTLPSLPPMLNATFHAEWRTRYIREQEYQSFTYSFFAWLGSQGKLVVNPPTAYINHNSKAQFYENMRANGFEFPRTLTTNSPERARAFVKEMGEVVVKPGIGIGSTRRLRQDQLERYEDFALSPVTMQDYIRGQTVRVHIVGDTVVVSLKILCDEIDSRTHTKGFEFIRLPDEIERNLVRANRHAGLHFAAWDVIIAEDGRIVYLDCNPGPYLLWIGPQFVEVVFRQLARYMIAYARTHSVPESSAQITAWKP